MPTTATPPRKLIEKYKHILSHCEAMRTRDRITKPVVSFEHQLAIVFCGGAELERLTPTQIKNICEERINLLGKLEADHGEELSCFRQRWAEADARSPKTNANPLSTADNRQALSESIARENVLRARNSDLQIEISDLRGQVSAAETEMQTLRLRIESLENGTELRAAIAEAERCRNVAVISERNVGLLEGLCQVRGIAPGQAVHPIANGLVDRRTDIASRLENEKDPLKRGQIANQLREFDAEHSKKT